MEKHRFSGFDKGQINVHHPVIERLLSLGEITSEIAHELNNPLTAILGYSEILQRSDLDPLTREYVEKIHIAAMRTAKIVDGLLTFVRQEKPVFGSVDINETIRQTVSLFDFLLRSKGITLTTDLSKNLSPISGDAHKLQQVFFNILFNAVQALEMWDKKRLIALSSSNQGEIVRITISDTGPGIKATNVDKVFKPFFTTKPTGTGLGLSIAYGIIKEHGGEIFLISSEGKGCSYMIDLPAVAEDHLRPVASPDSEKELTKRVLVVEDDELVADAMSGILKLMGCDVQSSTEAADALEELKTKAFDIIFVDYRMPVMNGLEFIERASHFMESSKFVLVTGDVSLNTDSLKERYHLTVLRKPVSVEDFKKVILRQA